MDTFERFDKKAKQAMKIEGKRERQIIREREREINKNGRDKSRKSSPS